MDENTNKTLTEEEIAEQVRTQGTYAVHADPEAVREALRQCRGVFQRNLIRGRESLSLATLQGTAAVYGGQYRRSRDNLLARLDDAMIVWSERRGPKNRRVLVIGA